MAQKLNLALSILVYSDAAASNSPRLRNHDFTRQMTGVATGKPRTQVFSVAPGATETLMSTARSLSADTTTEWTVSNPTGSTYRYKWTGGTNPALRTNRAGGWDATTVFTITKPTDDLMRITAVSGTLPDFTAAGVVSGDGLSLEGPFNADNEGNFTVVRAGTTWVEVDNEDGIAEASITLLVADNLLIYAASGVQAGDMVDLTDTGFNPNNRGTFTLTAVTSKWFEIANNEPGIAEVVTQAAVSGVSIYSSIFQWLYMETDQKVAVKLNGDTSEYNIVDPITPADEDDVGVMIKRGKVFSVAVLNKSETSANITLLLSE